jgi:hypothetical protein
MSVTEAKIEELDVVAFRRPERIWPAGTDGTVIADCGIDKLVEVADEFGEGLDFIWVPTEQLRLIWKRPAND